MKKLFNKLIYDFSLKRALSKLSKLERKKKKWKL